MSQRFRKPITYDPSQAQQSQAEEDSGRLISQDEQMMAALGLDCSSDNDEGDLGVNASDLSDVSSVFGSDDDEDRKLPLDSKSSGDGFTSPSMNSRATRLGISGGKFGASDSGIGRMSRLSSVELDDELSATQVELKTLQARYERLWKKQDDLQLHCSDADVRLQRLNASSKSNLVIMRSGLLHKIREREELVKAILQEASLPDPDDVKLASFRQKVQNLMKETDELMKPATAKLDALADEVRCLNLDVDETTSATVHRSNQQLNFTNDIRNFMIRAGLSDHLVLGETISMLHVISTLKRDLVEARRSQSRLAEEVTEQTTLRALALASSRVNPQHTTSKSEFEEATAILREELTAAHEKIATLKVRSEASVDSGMDEEHAQSTSADHDGAYLSEQCDQLEKDKLDLQRALARSREQIRHTQIELENERSQHTRAKRSLDIANQKMNGLQENAKDLSDSSTKLVQLQDALAIAKQETKQTKGDIERYTTQISQLEQQLADANDTQTTLEQKLQEKEAKISEYKSETDHLKSSKYQIEKRLEELETFNQQAQSDSVAGKRQQEELSASIASGQKKNASLQSEIDELKQHNKDLKEQLGKMDAAQEKNASLQSEIDKLSQQNKGLKKQLDETDAAQVTNASLQSEIDEFKRRNKDLKEQLDKKDAAVSELEVRHDEATTQLEHLRTKISEYETQIDRYEQEMKANKLSVVEQLENAKKEQDSLAAQLDELRNQKTELKKLLEAAKAQHEQEVQKLQANHKESIEKASQIAEQTNAKHQKELSQLRTKEATMRQRQQQLFLFGQQIQRQAKHIREDSSKLVQNLRQNLDDMRRLLGSNTKSHGTLSAMPKLLRKILVRYDDIEERYKKEMLQRRAYFNQLQELRGNIRVFCRARPLLPSEAAEGETAGLKVLDAQTIQVEHIKGKVKRWELDCAFGQGTTNERVFEEASSIATSVMDGYKACIFAYGQTGSGKTYTMEGDNKSRGVNYRALEALFAERDSRKNGSDYEYTFELSMLEIYNETIRDMLVSKGTAQKKLTVREGSDGTHVPDLTIEPIESFEDVLRIMAAGYGNRTSFATNMNEHSSRSHCMVTVYVHGRNNITSQKLRGKLNLIDLAGSERVRKSGVTGDRLKEAQNINRSLSALGDVIAARVAKKGHTPYRNSVLTFLLQDSLAGDSKTLMFVNVSPTLSSCEETYASLNFASRVRNVELGKATKHIENSASRLDRTSGTPQSNRNTNGPPSGAPPSGAGGSRARARVAAAAGR